MDFTGKKRKGEEILNKLDLDGSCDFSIELESMTIEEYFIKRFPGVDARWQYDPRCRPIEIEVESFSGQIDYWLISKQPYPMQRTEFNKPATIALRKELVALFLDGFESPQVFSSDGISFYTPYEFEELLVIREGAKFAALYFFADD